MPLLEFLGIPRIRVKGISILNVFGTMTVSYLMTRYIGFLEPWVDFFQLTCLLLVLAVITHYSLGDYTPLVRLCINDKMWRGYVILLAITGIFGSWGLKYATLGFTGFLILKK